MNSLKTSLIGAASMAVLFGTSLSAQTVALYSFDSGAFLSDTSGNGNNLTNAGAATQSATVFPDTTINSSNTDMANLANGAAGMAYLQAGTTMFNAANPFTVEGMISFAALGASGRQVIASEYGGSSNRGMEVYLSNTGVLIMELGRTASTSRFYVSNATTSGSVTVTGSIDTMSVDTEYYFAAVFEGMSGATGSVTFFLQDITNGGSLDSVNITRTDQDQSRNTTQNFTIGARPDGAGTFPAYQLDEVRISSAALSAGQLATPIPEPGAYALAGAVVALGVVMLRRRRRS